MNELIESQLLQAKKEIERISNVSLTDSNAFNHMILKYFFEVDYNDQIGMVTDGANDGGIDFVFYDEEEAKVVVGQSKYTKKLSYPDIIAIFNQMSSTVGNFKNARTGQYNFQLKNALQNAIDRLPDDNPDNIEYDIFTTADVNIEEANNKIEKSEHQFSIDSINIFTENEIEKTIQRASEALDTVKTGKLKLDKAKNYLEYESDDSFGIMCNLLSTSLIAMWNKYAGAGLFDLNIRKYIRNKLVDNGIIKTLNTDRSNFWFMNNGIIIACEDFRIDGNVVNLTNFSIVNGGQTTTLIGTYKGRNQEEFYIPCKIVCPKDRNKAETFFTKIAEATNSQKPIYARDLKSNAPEMVLLSKLLKNEGIYLEIKRGSKEASKALYKIKNDELGQLILSFAYQRPGTARSGKKAIFENQSTYDQIFRVNYAKDKEKKAFLIDLIKLNDRYVNLEKKIKSSHNVSDEELEILKNGKQVIIAVMGLCYRIVNQDICEKDISNCPKSLLDVPFTYGPILSEYNKDDIDEKFLCVVQHIIDIVLDAYKRAFDNKTTTSVSNFMKTDLKYYSEIAVCVINSFKYRDGKDLLDNIDIFKR